MNNLSLYQTNYTKSKKILLPSNFFENLYNLFLLVFQIYTEIKDMWNNSNWFTRVKSIFTIANFLKDKGYDVELKFLIEQLIKQDKEQVITLKLNEEE